MTHYQNPIIPGFHPDPSICRVDQDYYLVTSSFEYFPGVPIFHSHDLVHWSQIGHCLSRPEQLPLANARASGGIYAPTLRFHAGLFYMITTNVSAGGHFYVTARQPAGPWSDPVWLPGPGIDPSLLFEDGRVYFTHNDNGRICQREIDPATGQSINQLQYIWDGCGAKYPESPHLYKINGAYYLLCAEGGTEYGHMVTIARAPTPYGPFTGCPSNPILTHRSLDNPLQGTGHADLFQDHLGSWWLVFLAFRPQGYPFAHHLGRETCLAPVRWTEDGWPVVNGNGRVGIEMDGPLPGFADWPVEAPLDDFNMPALNPCWNYLRNPEPGNYSLTDRLGWLRLMGSKVGLDAPSATPTWIGRRQEHLACQASAYLDFNPGQDGDEAGLVLWQNERHHYEIAVTRLDGRVKLIVRRRIGSLAAITFMTDLESGPIILRVTAEDEAYHFSYKTDGGEFIPLNDVEAESRYLSTEVGGMFTGVYIAMYASGNGHPSQAPADFDWFEYKPLR
jgi:xylan 1,4-beta-xylosidase